MLLGYLLLFEPTSNPSCLDFYAKQDCQLKDMTWDNMEYLPYTKYYCLKNIGNTKIDYNDRAIIINFTDDEVKQCTNKPIINFGK